jgi:hypothetical protein
VTRASATLLALMSVVACGGASKEPTVSDDHSAGTKAPENHQILNGLTLAKLASIPDADVEQAVFDSVAARIGEDYQHEVAIVARLPIGAQALYITSLVDGEVNNGGFNQFYWNSSGTFADQAAEAFEFFSAHEHAALMREANSVRALEAAKIEKYKDRGSLDGFSDSYKESKLGPIDDKYYALKEDLSRLRIAKIRSMPEFFAGK